MAAKRNTKKVAAGKSLLFEIGTEELPPKSLLHLGESLHEQITQQLIEQELLEKSADKGRWFATPRRLAVLIPGISACQADQTIERRGPAMQAAFDATGNPTRAAEGFARSNNCGVDELQTLETEKGSWLVYRQKKRGASARILIPEIVGNSLNRLPIAKRMRWGCGDSEFIRPVHWLVLMLGNEVMPASFFGIKSGGRTFGHRFHSNRALRIRTAERYEKTLLEEGHVIPHFLQRQRVIEKQIMQLAKNSKAKLDTDESLLLEVTALVEWPRAILGTFDPDFLATPEEALVSSMRDHQKYFHLRDAQGRLLPKFITVSNIESRDPGRVRNGNERVLQARLSDAQFFWNSDCKQSLLCRREDLRGLLFHIKLGNVLDKTRRIEFVAEKIAAKLGFNVAHCRRSASLCKADLVSDMVTEFPALQGTMGRYYALNDGEAPAVANAIGEHYQPRFAGDDLPLSESGQVCALADKLDSLVGLFLAGEEPSGDKDRFALRRSILGCIRIIIEQELDLDMQEMVSWCWSAYQHQESLQVSIGDNSDPVNDRLLQFTLDRMQHYYLSKNITVDQFSAVSTLRPTALLEFDQRLKAVANFSGREEAQTLCAANKRIHNILKKTQLPAGISFHNHLLLEPAEHQLAAALDTCRLKVEPLLEQRQFDKALITLANLRKPVDDFFDAVMVMVDDEAQRNNRLLLLQDVRFLFLRIADVSQLQL